MTTVKRLGIWMDHSTAHLIEAKAHRGDATTIEAAPIHENKDSMSGSSEHVMHNKEQNHQADFYGKLANSIHAYEDVLLFGPTEAKSELFNLLRADHRFDKIKIETRAADKMTENQQQAFVEAYFAN
jgi:hypothetical protein